RGSATPRLVFEDVADTALWVAAYRARESSRPDALFRDPWAERLAGDRGKQLAREADGSASFEWSIVVRTRVSPAISVAILPSGGGSSTTCRRCSAGRCGSAIGFSATSAG